MSRRCIESIPPATRSLYELPERGLIHRHQHIGIRHHGRIDLMPGQTHMAVGGAGAHLRPIRRQPGNLEPGIQSGLGQHLAQQQDSLPAKAGYPHAKIQVRRSLICTTGLPSGRHSLSTPRICGIRSSAGAASGSGRGCASLVRSQNHPERKSLLPCTSRTQCCASTGVILKIVGQGDSTSISEKPSPRT